MLFEALYTAKPDIKYRDYQTETFNKIQAALDRGVRKMLVVKATGLGKTVDMAGLPSHFYPYAKHGILILVHRDELVHQAVEKMHRSNPHLKIGIEKAQYRADIDSDVVVASVQTLGRLDARGEAGRRLMRFAWKFGIIAVDETHHVKRGSRYEVVLNELGVGPKPSEFSKSIAIDRFLLGFTATPNRHDGVGLGPFYEEIVVNYDLGYGVDNGWLIKPLIFPERTNIDISSVKETAGDFNQKDLQRSINVGRRNSLIVDAYLRAVAGKLEGQHHAAAGNAIAFCAGIEHAKELASAFVGVGVSAVSIDKDTPAHIRRKYISAFKSGEIKIICNCGVLTEGFDASICDIILLARPTTSDSLYAQMIGRGTRPHVELPFITVKERLDAIAASDKRFLIVIDFVDNHKKNRMATAPSLMGHKDDTIPLPAKPKKKEEEKEEYEEDMFEAEAVPVKAKKIDKSVASTAKRDLSAESLDYDKSIGGLSHFNWEHIGPKEAKTENLELHIPSWQKPQALRLLKVDGGYKVQHIDLKTQAVNTSSGVMSSLEEAVRHCDKWIHKKTNPNERALMMRNASWRLKRGFATPNQIGMLSREFGIKLPATMRLKFRDAVQLIDHIQSQKVTEIIKQNG